MTPVVVMRPMLFPSASVNHSAPSGPAVIPPGALPAVGIGYSVKVPLVVMRPILFPTCSVNHRAPSGPAVIPQGLLPGVGVAYSVIRLAAVAGVATPATSPLRSRADRARFRDPLMTPPFFHLGQATPTHKAVA